MKDKPQQGILSDIGRQDMLRCLAWIGTILVIGGLVWFFTQSYRTRLLIETVNKALARNGVYEHIESQTFSFGNPSVEGQWFTLSNSSQLVYVFTLMHGGNTAASLALTESNGSVISIFPLGSNAIQIIEELPPPMYQFYAKRIEQNAKKRMGGRNR